MREYNGPSLGTIKILTVFAVFLFVGASTSDARRFDLDTGNAVIEVVIPEMPPAIRTVSPGANDASIVLRIVTFTNNAWFDALAPYHPTAVGVYSRLGRRPPGESATNRNKNIAVLYASYRVLNFMLPHEARRWRRMLRSVRLNPNDVSRDLTTPVGIGNVAGWSIVEARMHDGMNQLGDVGRKYNFRPYEDYTGYQPVNTAHELIDPGRWQPAIVTEGNGLFRVQQFVTPQYALTDAYTFEDPNAFQVPPPEKSDPANAAAYKDQADEVLAVMAALTDEQKGKAELFDDKLLALGGVGLFLATTRGLTMDEFVQLDFVGHMATFDGGIVIWNEKTRHDAVRPFSAIEFLYGDQPVTTWGGPGRGTVSDLPASDFRSYLSVADHPEYPSASTCFCAAYAQAARRYLGSDTLGYLFPFLRGASRVEPRVTPKRTTLLGPWDTWTEFVDDCGTSRVWGGVHFFDAVDESKELCPQFGDMAYEFLKAHIDGTAGPPLGGTSLGSTSSPESRSTQRRRNRIR